VPLVAEWIRGAISRANSGQGDPPDTKPPSHNLVAAILPSEIGNLYRTLGVEIVTLLPVPLVTTLFAVRPSRALFALSLVEAGHLAQV
jgi:hypothetical protein